MDACIDPVIPRMDEDVVMLDLETSEPGQYLPFPLPEQRTDETDGVADMPNCTDTDEPMELAPPLESDIDMDVEMQDAPNVSALEEPASSTQHMSQNEGLMEMDLDVASVEHPRQSSCHRSPTAQQIQFYQPLLPQGGHAWASQLTYQVQPAHMEPASKVFAQQQQVGPFQLSQTNFPAPAPPTVIIQNFFITNTANESCNNRLQDLQ